MVSFENLGTVSYIFAFHGNYCRTFNRFDTIHERDGHTLHDIIGHVYACIALDNYVIQVININCKTTAFITTVENFLLLHE